MASLLQRTASSTKSVGLVFFRHADLRLHDNELLHLAHKNHDHVLHLFIFDSRSYSPTATVDYNSRTLPRLNLLKTGPHRAQFLLEAVTDLSNNLTTKHRHPLLIQSGTPETILPSLIQEFNISSIYTSTPEADEEKKIFSSIEQAVQPLGCNIRRVWSNTLYHIDDLSFNPTEPGTFPATATAFRNKTERDSTVRPIIPLPSVFKPPPPIASKTSNCNTTIPSLHDLVGEEAATSYINNAEKRERMGVMKFVGGETAGLARMQDYFFDQDCLKDYFHTRNGMLGKNYSSKLSPWLAFGCLSARWMYQEVCRYEYEKSGNAVPTKKSSKDVYWMLFELNVRDYFRYYQLHWGTSMFHMFGPKGVIQKKDGHKLEYTWTQDLDLFNRWITGTTGNPMIDANMREVKETGFMSNRGRQIVASYLTRDFNLDWRLGAMYFESVLIDHDVGSNWGSWTYAAGVGSDPRENRYFSIPKQVKNYDPDHKYIRHWVSEMGGVSKQQLSRQLTRGCRQQISQGNQQGGKYGKGKGNKGNNKGNRGGKGNRKNHARNNRT